MEEPFIITMVHKGQEKNFEAQLVLTGYTHRFEVQVGDVPLWYERDESGAYRALLPPTVTEKQAIALDKELLQIIAEKIAEILS